MCRWRYYIYSSLFVCMFFLHSTEICDWEDYWPFSGPHSKLHLSVNQFYSNKNFMWIIYLDHALIVERRCFKIYLAILRAALPPTVWNLRITVRQGGDARTNRARITVRQGGDARTNRPRITVRQGGDARTNRPRKARIILARIQTIKMEILWIILNELIKNL